MPELVLWWPGTPAQDHFAPSRQPSTRGHDAHQVTVRPRTRSGRRWRRRRSGGSHCGTPRQRPRPSACARDAPTHLAGPRQARGQRRRHARHQRGQRLRARCGGSRRHQRHDFGRRRPGADHRPRPDGNAREHQRRRSHPRPGGGRTERRARRRPSRRQRPAAAPAATEKARRLLGLQRNRGRREHWHRHGAGDDRAGLRGAGDVRRPAAAVHDERRHPCAGRRRHRRRCEQPRRRIRR